VVTIVTETTQRFDDIETDYSCMRLLRSDLEAVVRSHNIVIDIDGDGQITGKFENGWLQTDRCSITFHVRVTMDAPGWRIAAFEDRIESVAAIVDRTVRGSYTAPEWNSKTEAQRARPTHPPETRRAHVGYYTIERDVTDRLPSSQSTTLLD